VVARTDTEILRRVIEPDRANLSPEAARFMLGLDFPEADHERMALLSDKANVRTLSDQERAELEGYIRVSDFLALVQAKARLALRGIPGR
jgi:hypothetical protein